MTLIPQLGYQANPIRAVPLSLTWWPCHLMTSQWRHELTVTRTGRDVAISRTRALRSAAAIGRCISNIMLLLIVVAEASLFRSCGVMGWSGMWPVMGRGAPAGFRDWWYPAVQTSYCGGKVPRKGSGMLWVLTDKHWSNELRADCLVAHMTNARITCFVAHIPRPTLPEIFACAIRYALNA